MGLYGSDGLALDLSWATGCRSAEASQFGERAVGVRGADDDMVEDGDVEEHARRVELPRDADVVGGGRWIEARVIVHEHDSHGASGNGGTEHLSGVDG